MSWARTLRSSELQPLHSSASCGVPVFAYFEYCWPYYSLYCSINGNCLTPTLFREVITSQFRDVFLARVISITDLNVILLNPEGTTGVVAQNSKYETKGKADGQVLVQSATTIVQVEEQNGKKVMSIFEAQTVDEQ